MSNRTVPYLIQTLLMALLCGICQPINLAQDSKPQEEWDKDDSFGLPIWIADNSVDDEDPTLANRCIYLFIEPENFTTEKVQKVVKGLAAQYPVPHNLWIYAYSDRQVLQRILDKPGICGADGSGEPSLETRRLDRDSAAREVQEKKGYLYADYYRLDEREVLEFKPDPEQQHTWEFDLKHPDGAYTGVVNKDLLAAAEQGDIKKVRELLEAGVDVNVKGEYQSTPLMHAAEKGHPEIVKLLLENGADADLRNEGGNTALMFAASDGSTEAVEALLGKGAAINGHNNPTYPYNADTALILAALHGHLKTVQALIGGGANLEEKNVFGETALLNAAVSGAADVVEYLIGCGADVRVRGLGGKTVLMLAGDGRRTVEALLRAGADWKTKDTQGETALMGAVRYEQANKTQPLIAGGAGAETIEACRAWIANPPTGGLGAGFEKEEGYRILTEVYLLLCKQKEAVEASKQALKEIGDKANLRARLGSIYLAVGDKKAAMEQYRILKQQATQAKDEHTKENYNQWAEDLLEEMNKQKE